MTDEVYCERWADAGWPGIHDGVLRVCSRCQEPVIAGDHPGAALICTRCLSELVGPVDMSMPADWHPTGNPMHCADCYFKDRRR